MATSEKETMPIKVTEVTQPHDLPALYIHCTIPESASDESPQKVMDRVLDVFQNRFPNHHVVVGNVDLKFAYVEGQKMMYHELKKDYRSR